jgi:hypothetical protein
LLATSTSCNNLPSSIDIRETVNKLQIKLQIITDSSLLQTHLGLDKKLNGLTYPDAMGDSGKDWDKKRYKEEITDFFNKVANLLKAPNLPNYLENLAKAYNNHYQALNEPTTTTTNSQNSLSSSTFNSGHDQVLSDFADYLHDLGFTAEEFRSWAFSYAASAIINRYKLNDSDLFYIQAKLTRLERENTPSSQQKNNRQRLPGTHNARVLNPAQLETIEALLQSLENQNRS